MQLVYRRWFLKKLFMAASGFLLLRCSSETTTTTGTQNACNTASTLDGAVSNNHGHTLTIPHSDVVAGVDKTYAIDGTAGHSHSVTITAAHFTQLQNNQTISGINATVNGHPHTVTVFCA
ncbi:MAG: hypothetical protein A4S09_00885 [Proteobacteria bacterium SG_bin7]|nr:MAG: hypothetical protein A4S09_00885 [Proteobacteria bacterium SG_bin7]